MLYDMPAQPPDLTPILTPIELEYNQVEKS